MQKWISFPILLVLVAVSGPAKADVYGWWTSSPQDPDTVIGGERAPMIVDEPLPMVGGEPAPMIADEPAPIVGGGPAPMYAPSHDGAVDGPMYGYPFHSGCCEERRPCCTHLWDGFCAGQRCGGFLKGHAAGGCRQKGGKACGTSGCSQKGGKACGFGGKGGCGGKRIYGGKGAWGGGGGCFGYGHGTCGSGCCGSKGLGSAGAKMSFGFGGHGRGCGGTLGLFDWMHFGQGKGAAGCSSYKGGAPSGYKGSGSYSWPAPSYDSNMEAPPLEAVPQPPEVHVAPTPTSLDNSAGIWFRRGPIATPVAF